jgi:hypothetical protein
MPPAGLGFDLCLFKVTTGRPCPGCGLTRSVSSALTGQLGQAVSHHPFGPLVLLAALLVASSLLWPRAFSDRVGEQLGRQRAILAGAAWVLLAAFLAFGVLRFALGAHSLWSVP